MMIMLGVTIVVIRNNLVRKRKIRNIARLLQLENAIYKKKNSKKQQGKYEKQENKDNKIRVSLII